MARKPSVRLVDSARKPEHETLTSEQLEALTDAICGIGPGDQSSGEALIVLMDEIEKVVLGQPLDVENITVPVKAHAFYRSRDSESEQRLIINEIRGKLSRKRPEG